MTMDNERAVIGGNNPPADDPLDEAIAPFADAIAEAENWLDGEPATTAEQVKAIDDLAKDIKAAKKGVTDAKEAATEPLHKAWKAEIARWKPTVDDLDRMAKGLASLVGPFKRKLAEEKAEAQRKAQAEKEAAEAELRKAREEANVGNIEQMREIEEAERAAKEAAKAASRAKNDTVKGLRTVDRYKIQDELHLINWIARNDKGAMREFMAEYAHKHHKSIPQDIVKSWTEKVAY